MIIFRELLFPPEVEGYEQTMKVKFLHMALLVCFVVMPIFGYLNIDAAPTLARAMFLTSGTCLIGLYLNAKKKYIFAASILTSIVILINFYNLYDGISLHDPGITVFPLIIIFSGFLFGKKSIFPITVINLVGVFLLVYFERTGVINPPEPTGDERVIIISVLMVASAILIRTIIDNWGKALDRARSSEMEIKKALEDVSKIRDELEVRVQERTAQLKSTNEELEAFSYSISHDLRAPLRAINGFSAILKENYGESLDDEGNRYLDILRTSTLKMDRLINDLLSLSRLGRREIRFQPVNITSLAERIYAEVINDETDRTINFQVADCPIVEADPQLLEILLTNLLSNAVKFTLDRNPAEIEFGCLKEGDSLAYFIKDNGVGFDMAYADNLFGAFQRLHSEKDFEGTGIGLAIVKRIAQRHGGRIWAEAEPDKGAIFYFTIETDEMK